MPCYNSADLLEVVLRAYEEQVGGHAFEVIAIDDASTDDTYQTLSHYQANTFSLRVYQHPINKGPAAARNLGIEQAKAPLLIFVGADIEPDRDFIHLHLKGHQLYPEIGAAILGHTRWADHLPVNQLMRYIDGVGSQQFSYFYMKAGESYDFRHFYTCNISAKAGLFHDPACRFDTDFPFAAFEDAELALRLSKEKNFSIHYLGAPSCQHYHYHNIYSFTRRQYRAGMMGALMYEKHPKAHVSLEEIEQEVSRLVKKRPSPRNKHSDTWQSLEEKAFLLGNEYEWSPSRAPEQFYLKTLQYFFLKGWVEQKASGNTKYLDFWWRLLAHQYLLPACNTLEENASTL